MLGQTEARYLSTSVNAAMCSTAHATCQATRGGTRTCRVPGRGGSGLSCLLRSCHHLGHHPAPLPALAGRNSRRFGCHGVLFRPANQRRQVSKRLRRQTGRPRASARWAVEVFTLITRSRAMTRAARGQGPALAHVVRGEVVRVGGERCVADGALFDGHRTGMRKAVHQFISW